QREPSFTAYLADEIDGVPEIALHSPQVLLLPGRSSHDQTTSGGVGEGGGLVGALPFRDAPQVKEVVVLVRPEAVARLVDRDAYHRRGVVPGLGTLGVRGIDAVSRVLGAAGQVMGGQVRQPRG